MNAKKSFLIYPKRHASGNVGYRVDLGKINGRRSFKPFPTLEAAQKFQQKCLKDEAHKNPLLLSDINAALRHEILAAVERLREFGATITEAADFYIHHAKPPKGKVTIQEVMDAFKRSKKSAGLSKKYLDTSQNSFFVPFRDHFKNGLIAEINKEACRNYIQRHKNWSSTTVATHIRHLSVLFNFAVDEGYLTLNPLKKVERPKRIKSTKQSRVMAVEDVIKLLQ